MEAKRNALETIEQKRTQALNEEGAQQHSESNVVAQPFEGTSLQKSLIRAFLVVIGV
jgi:hypothetical protein